MKPERLTRQEDIDLQLGRAGWAVDSRRLMEEFLVEISSPVGVSEGTNHTANEFAAQADRR